MDAAEAAKTVDAAEAMSSGCCGGHENGRCCRGYELWMLRSMHAPKPPQASDTHTHTARVPTLQRLRSSRAGGRECSGGSALRLSGGWR